MDALGLQQQRVTTVAGCANLFGQDLALALHPSESYAA